MSELAHVDDQAKRFPWHFCARCGLIYTKAPAAVKARAAPCPGARITYFRVYRERHAKK